jgi:hypothetical protein
MAGWPTPKVYDSDVKGIKELLYSIHNQNRKEQEEFENLFSKLSGELEEVSRSLARLERKADASMGR